MFCITTLNEHHNAGHSWKKGQTGEAATQLRLDAQKHHGVIFGNLGFTGTIKYDIISGVIFNAEEDRQAFMAEFGKKYNAKLTNEQFAPGIDTDDVWF